MEKLKKFWKGCINWKGWTTIKSWKHWKVLKKKKFWKVVLITITTICLISGCIIIGIFFKPIAAFLFTSENRNGELVKVILSVFGGIGLFYGLFINSRRIKEQTRQNNISEYSNSDKRFGDAIGYLGSDNTSIVLGGIYAIFQLAKEDNRYKTIVAKLYTSFIREKSEGLYSKMEKMEKPILKRPITKAKPPIEIETIITLLFSDKSIFYGEFLDFSNTTFKNVNFYGDICNCSFECSIFTDCKFHSSIRNCNFELANFEYTGLGKTKSIIDNCIFWGVKCDGFEFKGILSNNLNFRFAKLKNCKFSPNKMQNCNFLNAKFEGTSFSTIDSFKGTVFSKVDKGKINFENCIENEIEYS